MRIAWADPPYPGCAHLYKDHPDYAGEVDLPALVARLAQFDGWLLNSSSVALREVLSLLPSDARCMAWVKPFAAFKRNVPVAYAWEPVFVKPCRKPVVGRMVKPLRDYISCPITLKRGMIGAKPEAVCWWGFEVMGANPEDELSDLFPGSGAVVRAWESWRAALAGEKQP